MFFLLISGVGKSMFQNCWNLFKVYPHIAWTKTRNKAYGLTNYILISNKCFMCNYHIIAQNRKYSEVAKLDTVLATAIISKCLYIVSVGGPTGSK